MSQPSRKSGLLIAFEGIDGSGKTTNSSSLAEFLRQQGHEVIQSKEPTDGPWGRKIRATASTGRLSTEEELEFFLRDRRDHVENLITPNLENGNIVILDRYYFSTMAYQGSRGKDPSEIQRENEIFAPRPDLLFILDLDVDTALGRIGGRGDVANEFEKHDSLEKCREIFLALEGPQWVHLVSSQEDQESVQARIREIVSAHLAAK